MQEARAYPFGVFFLFFLFFLFVIMHSLFLRYKQPHAALAMERTKPINQKQITKESLGTSLISTIAKISPPPGLWPRKKEI